tara:strand:- start:1245 stop:1388 length:144 start_codon:yes stop_codon:yes gene_type:complete
MTVFVERITVRLTPEEKNQLDRKVLMEVRSMNEVIRKAIKEYCNDTI